MAGLTATYVDADTFTVVGDLTTTFIVGRRVKADCGVDGYKFGTIESVSFGTVTTVNLTATSDDLTSNLDVVWYGIVGGGAENQSMPIHDHSGDEGSGGFVGGGFHKYNSSEGESSTSSATPQQKVRLTASSAPSGRYRIDYSYEMTMDDDKNSEFNAQVQINDTDTIHDWDSTHPDPKNDKGWMPFSGFYEGAISNGDINIDLDYWDVGTTGVSIRRARLSIDRIR